jgi:hypothetical protein
VFRQQLKNNNILRKEVIDMTIKKKELIMYYDEKERRWVVETMELEEEVSDLHDQSDENHIE